MIAGVLFGLATKLLFDLYRPDWSAALPWSVAAGFGFVLCLMGIVGDLLESLLQARREGQGHGRAAARHGRRARPDRSPLLGLPTMYYLLLGYVFPARVSAPPAGERTAPASVELEVAADAGEGLLEVGAEGLTADLLEGVAM
ncbi:MAG: hypothetical protein R3E53_22720 [Myxococcota bacterium]